MKLAIEFQDGVCISFAFNTKFCCRSFIKTELRWHIISGYVSGIVSCRSLRPMPNQTYPDHSVSRQGFALPQLCIHMPIFTLWRDLISLWPSEGVMTEDICPDILVHSLFHWLQRNNVRLIGFWDFGCLVFFFFLLLAWKWCWSLSNLLVCSPILNCSDEIVLSEVELEEYRLLLVSWKTGTFLWPISYIHYYISA